MLYAGQLIKTAAPTYEHWASPAAVVAVSLLSGQLARRSRLLGPAHHLLLVLSALKEDMGHCLTTEWSVSAGARFTQRQLLQALLIGITANSNPRCMLAYL